MNDAHPQDASAKGDLTSRSNDDQLDALNEAFHAMHERIFAVRDPGSVIEYVGWTATARCGLRAGGPGRLAAATERDVSGTRKA